MPRKQGVGLSRLILASVWGLSVCAGMGILVAYETQPGEAASPPERWPETSGIEKDAERPDLVMLAHPRCPCTRASIGELARIMASCKGRLVAHVLFLKPGEFEKDWAHSDLWRSARIGGPIQWTNTVLRNDRRYLINNKSRYDGRGHKSVATRLSNSSPISRSASMTGITLCLMYRA